MPPRKKTAPLKWAKTSQLLTLVFEITTPENITLPPQYSVALNAWLVNQVKQYDAKLFVEFRHEQNKHPFTISELEGNMKTNGKKIQLFADETYKWYITALSRPVTQWMAEWLKTLPRTIELREAQLKISSVKLAQPAITYKKLWQESQGETVALSFITPTTLVRRGNYYPLPAPSNLFQHYLRLWNEFSGIPFDQSGFLGWLDERIIILRHKLESVKVVAGKKDSLPAFVGAIEFGLSKQDQETNEFEQLLFTLGNFATYCGTGHHTNFGLGQTRLGWNLRQDCLEGIMAQSFLGKRIDELRETLMAAQKRKGGTRALNVCQTRATILARQEFGETLLDIAKDLEMPYETVKTYAKLARRVLRDEE